MVESYGELLARREHLENQQKIIDMDLVYLDIGDKVNEAYQGLTPFQIRYVVLECIRLGLSPMDNYFYREEEDLIKVIRESNETSETFERVSVE